MAQITSGARAVLSIPFIYSSFQYLMGARCIWRYLANDVMHVKSSDCVLDIGCGPADLLAYLPENVTYWGFDISEDYIKKAKLRYRERGHFVCKLLEQADLDTLPKFDKVVLTGVFHHVSDDMAHKIVGLAYSALKEGGQMVSVDPCYAQDQNKIARFLISKDRGQNVRLESDYKMLVSDIFKKNKTHVVHRAWIPYTHCYMVCTK
ncbi:MAG: class I SAM-dependent methyltransferase [Methylophilus methylotrophus]|uniref:Class I SAM-dependent methyltransferase n=1 Tax=Methylophilus methylotrophus TaxID=17 RepID=A0A5C7WL13_METME|nr:MAG: class I SAM-dependent methyltransferase [Methylophilus methylotrophus]